MKKLICLINSLGPGGAERQMCGLVLLLARKGYLVELWTYQSLDSYEAQFKQDNIIYKILSNAQNKYKRIGIINKALKNVHPDVVISYLDSSTLPTCIAKLLGGNFKLIVSERNTTQKISIHEKIKFFMYRWSDVIVPNSFSQEKFIKDNYPKLYNKVVTITNFVDINKFSPVENSFEINNGNRLIVVGRRIFQKNIINFIYAVSKLKDKGLSFSVDWYGNVKDVDYWGKCQLLINKLGIGDVLTFHNAVNNIVEEYHNHDAFCLPSIYEGYPNVLCEAMSCGMPVICSNVCDNADIVEDSGILFNPCEIDDMVRKIESYLLMPQFEKILMGKKCREIAIRKFSSEKFVEKYVSLIEDRY